MGVDFIGSRKSRPTRTEPKSENLYQTLLVKLYRLLTRRTSSGFNKVVLKRLCMSKIHRPPVSLSLLARRLEKFEKNQPTLVVVGSVTNDERLVVVPKMKVVALRFTKEAYRRIVSAGGSCINFDTFARENPTGKNTCMIQGKRTARTACKYFGRAPGLPGSHTRPRVQSVGRKFENGPRRRKMH